MNRIRQLREDMNLRQVDVAQQTGIDQKTLSNYETGKTNPDSYALIKLADFFGVSIDYLVGRWDSPNICADQEELHRRIDVIRQELNVLKNLI